MSVLFVGKGAKINLFSKYWCGQMVRKFSVARSLFN